MQKAKGDKERRKVVFILRIRQSEKVKLEKYSSPTRDIHNDDTHWHKKTKNMAKLFLVQRYLWYHFCPIKFIQKTQKNDIYFCQKICFALAGHSINLSVLVGPLSFFRTFSPLSTGTGACQLGLLGSTHHGAEL